MDPTLSPTEWQLASLTSQGSLQGQHMDSFPGVWTTLPWKWTQILVHGQSGIFKDSLVCSDLRQTTAWWKTTQRTVGGPARGSSWTVPWHVSWVIFGPVIPLSG